MAYHFPPFSVALLAITIISIALAVLILMRRVSPGGVPFALLMMALAAWIFFCILEWGAIEQPLKVFWSKFEYLGITTMPPLYFIFAAEYSRFNKWITKRNIGLMFVLPLVTLVLVATNEQHGLIWSNIYPSPESAGDILVYEHGLFFWIQSAYAYTLLMGGTVILIRSFLHLPRNQRHQIIILIIATLVPWLANLVYLAGFSPIKGMDLTPMSLVFTGSVLAFFIFRKQLFDIVPVASSIIIESMQDGVAVLDSNNVLIDINPAAKELTGLTDMDVIGKPIAEVLSKYPDIIERFRGVSQAQEEITIEGQEHRYVEVNISSLQDRKGDQTGRLIILRDITKRKHMEMLEQEQRSFTEALSDTAAALNSSLNFNEVLDRILDNVGRVVPHDAANIALVDEDGFAHFVNVRGYQEHGSENDVRQLTYDINKLVTMRNMTKAGKSAIVSDTKKDKDWYPAPGLEWIRSYIGAPVMIKGKLVGFINLDSETPDFFTREHAKRLEAFADQAAIAVRNAQLFEEEERHAEEMTSLYEIGLTITSGLDLNHVIQKLNQLVKTIADVSIFYLALYDPENRMMEFPFYEREGEEIAIPERNADKEPGLTGMIINNRKILYIPDLLSKAAKNYKNYADQSKRIPGDAARTYLGIPLILGDKILGVFSIQSNKKDAYSNEQIRLMETMATQASIAIDNARMFARMEELAVTDSLTNVFNRRHTFQLAEKEIARALRYEKDLSLILFDIDKFKNVNDTFGHLSGDKVLREITDIGKSILRSVDIFGRFGGEEFIVFLPETKISDAVLVAERIRSAVANLRVKNEKGEIQVTLSLGLTHLTKKRDSLPELLETVDQALYKAKREGRNCVAVIA